MPPKYNPYTILSLHLFLFSQVHNSCSAWPRLQVLRPRVRPATIINYLCVNSLVWLSWTIKIKTPHASHGILELNYKSLPCLIWTSSNKLRTNTCLSLWLSIYSIFIVKFKIKCLPASWPSIAFFHTDIMLLFCLPYLGYVSLPSYILLTAIIHYKIELKDKNI